jgi:alpha-galactosidase
MLSAENQNYHLEINPVLMTWTLKSKAGSTSIRSKGPEVIINQEEYNQPISLSVKSDLQIKRLEITPFGPCQVITAQEPDIQPVGLIVEYVLPESIPMLLIKITLQNNTQAVIQQRKFKVLHSEELRMGQEAGKPSDMGCYVNGWQSWSYSGTYGSNQKAVISHLTPFQGPKLYDAGTPTISKPGKYTSDMFGALLDRTHRSGILAGFLSQVEHFGHVSISTRGEVSMQVQACGDDADILPGNSVSTDWLAVSFLDLSNPDPLAAYLDAAALVNHVSIRDKVPVGWCSWYHYFTRIKPNIVRDNLAELNDLREQIPFDVVQIDDGFEKSVGDWLETRKYFDGEMLLLAEEIKENNFIPGIWLAPFIVHPNSDIYKDHHDWMLKDDKNKPVNAGWNWEKFCSGLDLSHPQVKEYIRKVIHNAVYEWGYPYLKLDFLYAGALPGKRYDKTLTRAKVLRQAMELVREEAGPDSYLLGCGAPLGSMLGLVDGMRIGTDVAPDWEPKYLGIELLFPNDPDIPSAKNALQNALSRAAMHRRWWQNDPDCLLLRESSHLTLAEVQTMTSIIALSGGLLLISDDMKQVSRYRLKLAQAMIPLIESRPVVMDWADRLTPQMMRQDVSGALGAWHVLSRTNWEEKPRRVTINLSDYGLAIDRPYAVRLYWNEKSEIVTDGKLDMIIPPHGTALMSVKEFHPDEPNYLGGNLHITQGIEVSAWNPEEDGLSFTLSLPHQADGIVDLYLPKPPVKIASRKEEIPFVQIGEHIYRLTVAFNRKMQIKVDY